MAAARERSGPNKGGRPPYVPTALQREEVSRMVGIGLTQDQIAEILGVSERTVRNKFKREIAIGKPAMIDRVAKRLLEHALKGQGRDSVAACIFVLKTQGGWTEKTKHEHTGKDGEPIKIESLTDEQLAEFIARLEAAGVASSGAEGEGAA